MRRLFTAALLLAPIAAFAASPCKYEAPRNLQLDLAGVRSVQIDVHSQDLHLTGSDNARGLTLTGRACASEQAMLDKLQVTQRREGDQLLIDIGNTGGFSFSLFGGNAYSSLEVTVQLPANLPVTVRVGSGDADVSGVQQLQTSVGSGDLHVRQVSGKFATRVTSAPPTSAAWSWVRWAPAISRPMASRATPASAASAPATSRCATSAAACMPIRWVRATSK